MSARHAKATPAVPIVREGPTLSNLQPSHRKMPAISLPKFNGQPTEWIEFRDLFTD